MRVLVKVSLPVETGNESAINNTLTKTIQSILADLKPEAAYFTTQGGNRGGFLVVDIQDTSQIPALAEPFFLAFNASVDIQPVMSAEDLARATPAIEQSVKKYATPKARAAAAS